MHQFLNVIFKIEAINYRLKYLERGLKPVSNQVCNFYKSDIQIPIVRYQVVTVQCSEG